jgi:hypothetical protein
MPEVSTYDYVSKQIEAMRTERSSFIDHYRELSRWVQPRRGRFLRADRNKGEASRHERNNLVNSAATFALRTARAGLLSGVMSPARPWFKLGAPDPDLSEFLTVKEWLEKVELIIRRIFNESNLYNMAPSMLGELLLFGTGAMSHVDNFDDVARFFTHTAGSYMLAQDENYKVSIMGREYEETTLQLVRKFGLDKVSRSVRDQYDKGNYHSWHPVYHLVEPNPDFDPRSPLSKRKKFRSTYIEADCNDKVLLRESGFEDFPVYAPRWEVTGEDIYATDCPGMTALGDTKALQIEEKRKGQAIEKMVNPPLHGPASLKNVPVSSLPGGLTVYDTPGGQGGSLAPIYMVNPKVQELMMDIKEVEKRIDRAFYVDMFLAISNMDGIQPRNEFELSQRNQERLLQIGPVLEQLHGEFLNRLIDRTFNQAWKAGILPPPPPELQGQSLKVEYISTLAMAQKAVATNNIDRLSAFIAGLAGAGYTGVLDKFDADQAVDEYAQALLVPAKLVVPDDIVAQRRAEREQAQRAALAMEMAKAGADVAKTASDAKTGEANALTRMIGQDEAENE